MSEPNPTASIDVDGVRAGLRDRVAGLMWEVLQSYDRFGAAEAPADAKAFAAHHAAGKAALAHFDALAKLSRWADGGGTARSDAGEADPMSELIGEVHAALSCVPDGDA